VLHEGATNTGRRRRKIANLVPDSDLQESVCAENEKDRQHFR
jgi:hypothetical protein